MANVIKKINIQDTTYNILPEYDSNYLSATTNNVLTLNLTNTITANQNAIDEETLRAIESEQELLKRIQGTSENSNYLDPIITLSEKPSEIINNLDTFFPQKVDGKVINVGNFRSYSDKGVSHLDIKVMVLAWANATQQEIFMQTVCGPLTIKSDKTLLWVNGKKFSHYYRLSSRDENNNLIWDNWKIVNDAEIEKYINPNVIQWNNEFNLNDYISHGDFIIRGNRTDIKNDNIPITNTGEIEAKLEVLSNQNNDTISQKLTLLNVNGGDYNIYTRVKQNDKWKPWSKLQTNTEVIGMINQTQMDDLVDNGMYSGVFENDGNLETFVLIVINNYAVAEASGNKGNQSICQLKYGLSLYDSIGNLGGVTLKMRKRDAFGFWGEWEKFYDMNKN